LKRIPFFIFSFTLILIISGCSTIESSKNPKSEDEFTSTPHNEGSIVVGIEEDSFIVVDTYKTEGAVLSESEVLRKAIKLARKKGKFVPGFRYINFDKRKKEWNLGILQDEMTYELKIKDEQ
jgi:hypothetical protein